MRALIAAASLLVLSGLVIHLFRFDLRSYYHDLRIRKVGGLAWYRVEPEGLAGDDRGIYGIGDMGHLNGLLQSLKVTLGSNLYLHRGLASFVWARSPSTGRIDFFLGTSRRHDRDGSVAQGVAKGMGGIARPMARPPVFPHRAPVTLWRVTTDFGKMQSKDEVDGSGHVVKDLSVAWEKMRAGESAAVFMSMEQIRSDEQRRLLSFLTAFSVIKAGEPAAGGSSLADRSNLISGGFRVSLAAANSAGNLALSRASLGSAYGAMATSGWSAVATEPDEKQVATSLAVAAGAVAALAPLALIFGDWLSLLFSLVPLVGAGLSAALSHSRAVQAFERSLARGEVMLPPYISINPLRFILGNIAAGKSVGGDQRKISHDRVAPPSAKQVLYLHLGAVFEFASFPERDNPGSNAVGGRSTQELALPEDMAKIDPETDVIYMGQDGKGQAVTYPVENLAFGIFANGSPGSGKSNFLASLYLGCCYYTSPTARQSGGWSLTPVWLETKGQGAYDVAGALVRARRTDMVFVDFNNPDTGFKFSLTGRTWSDGATVEEVETSCIDFVTGIQSAWGDSVRGASRDALFGYLLIAMLLTPYEIKYLGLDSVIDVNDINVIDLAYYLTGASAAYVQPGEGRVISLAEELREGRLEIPPERRGSTLERDKFLARAIGDQSNRLFSPQGVRTNASVISSVQNKLGDLRKLSAIWLKSKNPRCRQLTFSDIIGSGRPVILNMGGYAYAKDPETGALQYSAIDQSLASRVIRIYNYLQWNYIRQNCNGWLEARRLTPVFADEAADLASGASSEDVPDPLQAGTKDGRSFGNSYILGCQSVELLPDRTRAMVMSFRSKFWFLNSGDEDLAAAVRDLNSDRQNKQISEWNIRYQQIGTATGVYWANNTLTPPITLHTPYFKDWGATVFDQSVTSMLDAIALFQARHGSPTMIGRTQEIDEGWR